MMTDDCLSKLKRSLILHEGYKNYPYIDTVGKITIGIGYNLTDRGLDDDWINNQFAEDVKYFYNQLSQFAWFSQLCPDRQIILIDMAFMGWKKFLTFKKMIDALEQKDYTKVSQEMLNSEWAQQVKGRAIVLARGMLKGVYDV